MVNLIRLWYPSISARNKDQKLVHHFLKIGYFIGYYIAIPLKMYGPIKIDFGWPNAEIGRKMASGRLLFLALSMHRESHDIWFLRS